jgi:GMP reductase
MDTTGTFEMAAELSRYDVITCVHKHYTLDEWRSFLNSYQGSVEHIGLSIGISGKDIEKLEEILVMDNRFKFICIDVANGYTETFVRIVKEMREKYPKKVIIAGNVVTAEMTEELILAGADIVKVGIGPGSVCTTRLKTGVGYPQLSAVIECADAAHGLKGHIISDGGCVHPGDCSKAYGGGADFVMAGGMFAGHDESGGEVVEKDGKKYKLFYGMSSEHAMNKHGSGLKSYRSSEGKVVYTPYKGPVQRTLNDILGGIRSTCTYVGASSLKELSKRTTFIRTNKQVNTKYK